MVNERSALLRPLRIAGITLFATLVLLSCCWIYLYVDSLQQRRKAEFLISELKNFPFPTATFTDVRDFAIRHGGVALPECTPQDCAFKVEIPAGLDRIALAVQTSFTGRAAEVLYRVARCLGVRSWNIWSFFFVRSDRLYDSTTAVFEARRGRCYSYTGLIAWGYEVRSLGSAYTPTRGYSVGFPHTDGPPANVLTTSFSQVPEAATGRAFDIKLECFTTILHDCRGFGELAPSAWADYSASVAAPDNAECH
jgi:hypothetical protein